MAIDNKTNIEIDKAINTEINESNINEEVKKIIDKANAINADKKLMLSIEAVAHTDLASLKGNESFKDIEELCSKAAFPFDLNFQLYDSISTAAVCVFPKNVCDAIKILKNLNARDKVKIACVAGDFPLAQLPLETRIEEIKQAVIYGADEIDVVINRKLALANQWHDLYNELKLIRESCGKTKMKTILATGDLHDLKTVYIASIVAMLAGSDFIKTSTGKENVNATLPAGIVMAKAIRDYYTLTGKKIGLKPAGGIKTSEDSVQWMTLVNEELGNEWISKDLFRIGTSSMFSNIIKSEVSTYNNF